MEKLVLYEEKKQEGNGHLGLRFFIPLLTLFIVVIVLADQWKMTLKIERIIVQGARIHSAEDIVKMTGINANAKMHNVDLSTIRQRLLNQPYIKQALLQRQYPDALAIVIVEREPIAILSESQLRYIDEEGVMLPHIETPVKFDLPLISGIDGLDSVKNGQTINSEEILRAIEVLKTSFATGTSRLISEINMNNKNDINLYSVDGGVLIVLGRGDIETKFRKLQSFWNNFVNSNNVYRLQYIDLRYEGQIVVKWKHNSIIAKG